jgi:acyl-CoA synthetase (AMP-forming)/AMP-acid ligase II
MGKSSVPARFNIAEACCGRWARRPGSERHVAIAWQNEAGAAGLCSYAELQRDADRLAAALQRLGVRRGDRVAIVMPQRPETAVAHMAIYQLGAVAMPLSMLFGPEALAYRLQDSGARVAIADESAIATLRAVRGECPSCEHAGGGRRRARAGRCRLAGAAGRRRQGRERGLRAGRDRCRRPRGADLHQRHHRPARRAR